MNLYVKRPLYHSAWPCGSDVIGGVAAILNFLRKYTNNQTTNQLKVKKLFCPNWYIVPKIVLDCFSKIDYELERGIDKHSKRLIVSNIELFLDYSVRFYERQFITRDHVLQGVLEKFENLLNEYFKSDKPQTIGLPSVTYCAEQLNLSPNYFGDLVKKDTGKTAQEYIQSKLIDLAKEKVFDVNKTINQVAYELGFKYPQHFTRIFKKRVGQTPNEYRSLN